MLRRVPVHGYIYKKHRALLRALRVEKQKEPAQWMRRCGFRTGGSNGPAAVPSAAAPALQGPASQREVPSGALPAWIPSRSSLAELGMGSGGRRASQSDAAHPGGFYGTDAPEELSFGTPGGPGSQRRYQAADDCPNDFRSDISQTSYGGIPGGGSPQRRGSIGRLERPAARNDGFVDARVARWADVAGY